MISISGYQLLTPIYETRNSLVYRGIREQDKQPVILKILKEDYPRPSELTRYQQEYQITHNLNLDGVIKAYSLEKYQKTLIIIFEDFGGESLKQLFNDGVRAIYELSLQEFLRIALKIAEGLGQIHAAQIIHKDINPANIVFNRETQQLKIIDFGISTVLTRENPTLKNPQVLEGTLAYMSPEQTGRMNRYLDYRTDFYSLGVTFYQLLTHQLPFRTYDPLELVHCHIAKNPVPPYLKIGKANCPKVVSDIVMKLMAKTAEERYQSAWGIKADLEKCLEQLEGYGKISEFTLGSQDISDKFQIPQKLYGRDQEIITLLAAFERVSSNWLENHNQGQKTKYTIQSELMLVAGYAGIGKSALVAEIYKPITKQRGYFISGKCDKLQRNMPYSPIVTAFSKLVQQLLTESEFQLNQWRTKLQLAFGSNGQVIIDVIPELELIVGKQPAVTELGATESQNRFNLVFQNLIKVFAQPDHPLVIFLDDLQWADTATLKLVQLLMTATDCQYQNTTAATISPVAEDKGGLFLIGAYRDNEVNEAHPLMLAVDEIRQSEAIVNQLSLRALELTHINQLISDTLKCIPERTKPLAELVLSKTGGNPFFINEFLRSLYTEGLLEFNVHSLSWQWDLQQIMLTNFTDNVIELMALKIQKLPTNTQQVLQRAACIGNQFELSTLSLVADQPQRVVADLLWEAVAEGSVIPLGDTYRLIELDLVSELSSTNDNRQTTIEYKFTHDRIRQAAHSLIPEEDKQAAHLQVGQLLLAHTTAIQREQKIFDIVNQLNLGSPLIKDISRLAVEQVIKTDELAKLNLLAGKKAKASAAYKPALQYFEFGIELLDGEDKVDKTPDLVQYSPSSPSPHPPIPPSLSSWQRHYDLTLALFVEAAEAAYLTGDFERQDKLTAIVLQQANQLLDKVKVYEVKIQAYIAQNQLTEAMETALAVLKLLGVKFPAKPNKWDIWRGLLATKLALAGKKIEDLVNLPPMRQPNKLAAMRILSSVISAAYFAMPELMPLIVFKQVNLSIKYGNAALSASAYGSYGLILCDFAGDIDTGYRFGQLALSLLSQVNANNATNIAAPTKAKTWANVNFFVKPWKEHLNFTLQPLLEAYTAGLETGDLQAAGYAAHNYCLHSYFSGKELSKLQAEMATYGEVLTQLKQERTLQMNKLYRQVLLNLREQRCAQGQNHHLQDYQQCHSEQDNQCYLSGELYQESQMLAQHQDANDLTAICVLYFNKLILCYLFGFYQQSVANAAIAQQYLEGLRGSIIIPLFHFYDSLARLAMYGENPQSISLKPILQQVVANQKKLKKWADYAPMNHLHKFYLVEAERYRILGRVNPAADLYDRAITLAKENGYLQEEALGNELAGKFYLAQSKTTIARAYMLEAHYAYLKWGATAKVKDLEERYLQLVAAPKIEIQDRNTTKSTTSTTSSRFAETIDLATVMQAYQAISGEIILDNLLAKLMKNLIQNAGAEKGFLLLPTKTNQESTKVTMLIEAAGAVGSEQVKVLLSLPLNNYLPTSITNYVVRTQETVVLNDATCEGSFTQDDYIQKYQPKSILCCPLLNQGHLSGIIYLENNLTTDAFTPDRLEVIKLLSSQAAISIENAKLYSKLRERESQLTQFLEAIPVGVVVLAANGQPYYSNYQAKQLLGKYLLASATSSPEDNSLDTAQIYIAETNQLYPKEKLSGVRALRGESATINDLEIHQGDQVIPVQSWETPIFDEQGNIAYAIVALADITERKQAEAERIVFMGELETKNIALQEMNRIKDEFFKNTSHELRTPLNGIIGSIRLILDEFCDDRNEEFELLHQADKSAIHLLEIIDQILEIVKLKEGKFSVEIQPIDFYSCLTEVIDELRSFMQQKNLQLHRKYNSQALLVLADFTSLKQVLLNIMENAVKFTDSGSITVTTKIQSRIEGENPEEVRMAVVEIQDTGIGIEPSQQNKLFQPFIMLDGSTTRSQGGIGLGLVIARKFIELMGGNITIESAGKNQGTTVAIALPLGEEALFRC
ncbi:MAG: AAA family ATPase [Symploca sp. SIO2G7]|nr:AAA family ATPase [Symploca sp. SIO2G7]